MYIKINDEGNIIRKANDKVLKIGTMVIINPKDEHYREAGYLPIINTDSVPEPPEGYTYVEKYHINTEGNGYIKYFDYIELPTPEPIVEDNIIEDIPVEGNIINEDNIEEEED
jgi:hypothetical protein